MRARASYTASFYCLRIIGSLKSENQSTSTKWYSPHPVSFLFFMKKAAAAVMYLRFSLNGCKRNNSPIRDFPILTFGAFLTLRLALSTAITFQLSVEKAMASRAAETSEKMEAKHKVTALQKAMV